MMKKNILPYAYIETRCTGTGSVFARQIPGLVGGQNSNYSIRW